MNTEEFLKNASSKNKNVGNNKYQDEIKNLNNKINEMVKSIKSKDEELDLFKRNFTDMQIHIQEKNIKTTEYINKLTTAEYDIKDLNNKILNLNNMNLMQISNLEKDKQNIQNEKEEYINNWNIVLNEKNDLQSRYDDIKLKYKETLSHLDSKINDFEDLNTKHTVNLRECNQLKELNNTKTKELNSIKQELSLTNNQINYLKIVFIEKEKLLKDKENQLKDINSRIENNMFKYNINSNDNQVLENTSNNEFSNTNDINSNDNQVFSNTTTNDNRINNNTSPIVQNRGLKLSRR